MEPDLDARLKVGDVLISRLGSRWTVEGRTPKGKLNMRSNHGTHTSYWWAWRSQLPEGWKLERGGVHIR